MWGVTSGDMTAGNMRHQQYGCQYGSLPVYMHFIANPINIYTICSHKRELKQEKGDISVLLCLLCYDTKGLANQ
ncbi:unnamed protein product [Haemonchus placei]|uniref:Ovule protein n=1 Tax=Haemonchus placei TaxID=6290 RepID=A0A0N4W4A9_HAEPC|nr:unnamed protein product [Haemonchus placei]